MARLPDGAKFLLDTGLLAEINRLVLHPRGLALAVNCEDNGKVTFCDFLYDHRQDVQGMIMGPELLAEIREKLKTAPPYCPDRLNLFIDGIEPLTEET